MDPFTLSAIMMAGSEALAGIGNLVGARNVARQAEREAQNELAAAVFQANETANEFERLRGRGKVAAAASGAALSGSALDVLGALAVDAKKQVGVAMWQGKQRADTIRVDGANRSRAMKFAAVGNFLKAGAHGANAMSPVQTPDGALGASPNSGKFVSAVLKPGAGG